MGFAGRTRGSGIIRVVEMTENERNEFVLTWLYLRLIVNCLVRGQVCLNPEGSADEIEVLFSLKRDEQFSIFSCSTQPHTNPHKNFKYNPSYCVLCHSCNKLFAAW